MDLYEGKSGSKRHLPSKKIPYEDIMYLGYTDWYDVVLVVEEWEFRIYNYEWWSWDSIVDGEHEDDERVADVQNYFGSGSDCFDKDSCSYCIPDFTDGSDINLMAQELYDACSTDLDETTYRLGNGGEPSNELKTFIRTWLLKIWQYNNTLCYTYYK